MLVAARSHDAIEKVRRLEELMAEARSAQDLTRGRLDEALARLRQVGVQKPKDVRAANSWWVTVHSASEASERAPRGGDPDGRKKVRAC